MMKNFYKGCVLFILVVAVGAAIPRIFIRDTVGMSQEYKVAALAQVRLFFDNPLESFMIQKMAIKSQNGEVINVRAYTLFGIKYTDLELRCKKDNYGIDCSVRRFNFKF